MAEFAVFQIVIVSAFLVGLRGQTVTVNMQSSVHSDPNTDSATLRCDFGIDDPTFSFFTLEWKFGSTLIADFFRTTTPTYYDFCDTPASPCTATRTSSNSELVLSSLEFPRDQGTYECEVTYDSGPQTPTKQNSSSLIVVVPATSVALFNASGGTFTNGSVVKLSSEVSEHIITCEVQDINPGATFAWTLDGNPVDSGLISNPVHVVGADNLTTSSSNVTLAPKREYDGQELKCKAVNYEDDPGVMISVTLSVDDPCDPNPCFNGGTCSVMSDGITATCECPTGFEKPLCETKVPTTPPPEPTQPTGTDGKPPTVPTTPPEPTQPTGTDGKPTEATDQPLSVAAIAGISCGCVLAGLCLIGIGIYLCYTYDCCIWCGEHCPWCREHCSCCRKPPKDGGNRDENIGMNNTGDSEEDHPTEKDQDHITKRDLS